MKRDSMRGEKKDYSNKSNSPSPIKDSQENISSPIIKEKYIDYPDNNDFYADEGIEQNFGSPIIN